MTTTTAPTAPVLAVAKDGQDFVITNEAGEILARATTRKEAREIKAELEAEALAPAEEVATEAPTTEEVAEVLTEAEAIVEEEWVPAEDDTTETGEAPAVEAGTVEVKVEAPKKAKKVVCSGSSAYVGYQEHEVTEHTKKGRAAWVEVQCPECADFIRAGVWFTEGGIPLNGTTGMAYLPKH